MISPPSSSDGGRTQSAAFGRLHPALQRWIWAQGWASLRDIQERAIPAILDGDHDVLISAATAGGKTEAAILPILTRVVAAEAPGIRVVEVSPLKALINDQYGRLEGIGNAVSVPIHRWHGDVSDGNKRRLLKQPAGLLLITPESLEAMFVRRGTMIGSLFAGLGFIVVDELHAFVGSERGRQLQTLLHRLELVLRRRVPRIGLSATLGDMGMAAEFLRPAGGEDVCQIVSSEQGGEVRLQIRGYIDSKMRRDGVNRQEGPSAFREIVGHIYENLRGRRNLIFINRKSAVEEYADGLRTVCEARNVPNEFFPHHGSLSKGLREDVERMLKSGETPVSAVCTSTLELGIDIGDVETIAQIGSPPAVASMRQRLGRSGRRGEPAVLRIYIHEPEIGPTTPILDTLRLETYEAAAMVALLVGGWCEPPIPGALHLSTLVQQSLSAIAQVGGAKALDLWQGLCQSGPFQGVDASMFAAFLRSLAVNSLLVQSSESILLLGEQGERLVNHYDFYSAFATDEEYRIEHEGRPLGSVPINHALIPGQMLIFGGRRWTVQHVDEEQKRISVVPAKGGSPPHYFGGGARIHDRVREEMFRLYVSDGVPAFLDSGAKKLLAQGRESFHSLRLMERRIVQHGDDCHAFLWAGDRVLDTIGALLRQRNVSSAPCAICLLASGVDERTIIGHFEAILSEPPQDPKVLAAAVKNKKREKHDGYLTEELLCADYASRDLDVEGARRVLQRVLDGLSPIAV